MDEGFLESGSKRKGIVSTPLTRRPLVVVAAKVRVLLYWGDWRRGMRKVAVQPAPRIRRSTPSIFVYGLLSRSLFWVVVVWCFGVRINLVGLVIEQVMNCEV